MAMVIKRGFATPEDLAAVLGIPKRRLHRLLKIAGPDSRIVRTGYGASRNSKKAVSLAKGRPRRKQTRGKAKKASRESCSANRRKATRDLKPRAAFNTLGV